jgi:uncharacterized protein with GYD domain
MATYITLLRYTQQGIQNLSEAPTRLDTAKEAFRKMGAELKEYYATTGQYDAVVISEAPDDATFAKVSLAIGMQGNVRTETLRAFTEDEYRGIVAALL